MTFDIIRHARTAWNDERRIQGQLDIPLSLKGRAQAERWAGAISNGGYDRVLSSDLTRAVETSRILNRSLGAPQDVDARLREQDWGDWAGLTTLEVRDRHREILEEEVARGWEFCPPSGESRKALLGRVLAGLADAARGTPGGRILVVTHGGVIKSLLYHFLNRAFLPSEPPVMKSYHLHRFVQEGDRLFLSGMNALNLEEILS